jgi:HPt (histidine-containing phosphotransfer) domain-containing protein
MSNPPFFDQAIFLELSSELGEEDTAEVLRAFLADGARKMATMTSAAQDRSTIKREAHSIKSSAATFGFAELSTLARELEAGVEGMAAPRLHECVEAIRSTFEKTAEFALTNLLNAGMGGPQ